MFYCFDMFLFKEKTHQDQIQKQQQEERDIEAKKEAARQQVKILEKKKPNNLLKF